MQITDEMLQIGLKKLVEAGLVSRHPPPEEAERNQVVLQDMLQAVLVAGRSRISTGDTAQRAASEDRQK